MANEILINQLFSGGYLYEKGNIGHEVINLFKDDEGDRYLYITPSGKIKGHDVSHVLFVRNVKSRTTVEVIAMATGLIPMEDVDPDDIRYRGASLSRIFKSNTYQGEKDEFSGNVTYLAKRVMVPRKGKRILLTLDKDFNASNTDLCRLDSTKKVIIPQGMRSYYSVSEDPRAFKQLEALVEEKALWEPADTIGELITDGSVFNQRPSFLEIIRKEDDELVFSNMFEYYFDFNHQAFKRFAEEVLGVKDMSLTFDVYREKNHIDLWIESNDQIIVIENKIRSGINGLDESGKSQLDKYRAFAEKEAHASKKKLQLCIFVPNYSSIDLEKHDPNGTYKVIKYKEIHRFFTENTADYLTDQYFPDFLRGLERQTMTMPELNFKTMKSRLLMKIAQAQ